MIHIAYLIERKFNLKRKAQTQLSKLAAKKRQSSLFFSALPDDVCYYILPLYLKHADLFRYAKTHKATLRALLSELESRLAVLSIIVSTNSEYSVILCDGLLYATQGFNKYVPFNTPNKLDKGFHPVTIPAPVKHIVTTDNFIIILTMDGLLYVAGDYAQGHFSIKDEQTSHLITETKHSFQLIQGISGKVLQLAAGKHHTLIQTERGLFAWGNHAYGQSSALTNQLVLLDNIPGTVLQLAAMDEHLLILTTKGLFSWGDNSHGQLGLGDNESRASFTQVENIPDTISQVVTGEGHTMILTDSGLYACGNNYSGQLGLSDNESRNHFTRLPNLLDTVLQIAVGASHTLVLTESALYSCGSNECTELGSWYLFEDNQEYDAINFLVKMRNLPSPIRQIYAGAYHTFVLAGSAILCPW